MTRRVLRTELLRGAAPVALIAVALGGVAVLFTHPGHWAGSWPALAAYLRVSLLVLLPLAVAAGAWQAGRERRRGMGELLASVPRARWQPVALAWVAVSLGCALGFLATFAVAGAFVAPVATYGGGGWWWTLAVGHLSLGTAAAVGVLIGRVVPLRVVAPLAGVATYAGVAVLGYYLDHRSGVLWLVPSTDGFFGGERLGTDTHLLQTGWFAALALTLLTLAAARRRIVALPAALLATGFALALSQGPGQDRWLPDPGARALVCAEGTPEVCVGQVHAFLLDDTAREVRAALAPFKGIPGVPRRVVETFSELPPPGTVGLSTLRSDVRGRLTPDRYTPVGEQAIFDLVHDECHRRGDREGFGEESPLDWDWHTAASIASDWALKRSDPYTYTPPTGPERRFAELDPAAQKAWVARYLAAAQTCDERALATLLDPR